MSAYSMMMLQFREDKTPQVSSCVIFKNMVDGLSENEREMVKRVAHLPKRACAFVDEGLMVGADVLVLDRGEDSHLVERILFLFVGEFAHLDLLEGVLDAIALPYDRIDATVSALTFLTRKNEMSH